MNKTFREILSVLSLTGLTCIVVPLQSFLVNKSDFPFEVGSLLAELAVYWILLTMVGVGLLRTLRKKMGYLMPVVLVALAIYVYLETGILSHDYPMLDGDIFFFGDRVRGAWDFSVLVVILAVLIYFRRVCYEFIHYIAIGVLLMSLASLADVKADPHAGPSGVLFKTAYSVDQVLGVAAFSAQTNTLVLVLDSMTTELTEDVITNSESVAASLRGFTLYKNNIGMHRCTDWGLPGLVTGKYMGRSRDYSQYMQSVVGGDSVFAYCEKFQIPTYLLASVSSSCNWTNRAVPEAQEVKENQSRVPTLVRLKGQQEWNLREIVMFRLLPFGIKRKFFFYTIKHWPGHKHANEESVLYPRLKSLPVSSSQTSCFHFYHTRGAHGPYLIDRKGNRVEKVREDYAGALDTAYYVWGQVASLLDALREKNVYDNSFIIITADHGTDRSARRTKTKNGHALPAERPFPVLLVKPRNYNQEISFSAVPTSHSRLHDLIERALTSKVSSEEISDLLKTQRRLFRDFNTHKLQTYDWWFDDVGNIDSLSIRDETK